MSGILSLSMHRREPQTTTLKSSTMRSGISLGSFASTSTGSSSAISLAPERWTVEKRRQEWDEELAVFRFKQSQKMRYIQLVSDYRAKSLHEKIFFSVRWANPSLSSAVEKLIFDYCDHLLGPEPELPFIGAGLLTAWGEKYRATEHEKSYQLVYAMCARLHSIVTRRDRGIVNTHSKMEKTTTTLEFRKHSELQWRTHQLKGQRDRYWTIWYLSANNMLTELKRLLDETPQPKAPARYLAVRSQMSISGESLKSRHEVFVDNSDPDFGFTAMHYAARNGHLEIIKLLVSYNADVNVRSPDGRTPLHLAAAYSNKASVLELLAAGADYYSVDNYSCTPLDLARQNGNKPTLVALTNWTSLLPPVTETEEVIDLSGIPLEFLATPEPVFELMSPKLQMMCRRLDSNDLEPSQLIRLCQRHSMMCLEEGFDKEAVKSALRRWSIAKTLYRCETETPTTPPAVQNDMPKDAPSEELVESSPNQIAQLQPECADDESVKQKTIADDVSEIESMFSEAQGYIIPDGEEGEKIRELSAAIILRKIRNASRKEKIEKIEVNSISLSEMGRDLSELLIMDGQERFAMSILLDCAALDGLEPTTVLAILARYCETGLVVIDLLAKVLADRLEYRGRGMKEHKIAGDAPDLQTSDLHEASEIVTYFSTVKRHRDNTSSVVEENKLTSVRREATARAVNASRNDQVTEKLLYRLAQRSARRLANKWIPRPYGDPIFKTENALRVNDILKEPNVDPFYEPLADDNLLCEEKILYTLERHVEVVVEAAELIVQMQEKLNEGFIVESCTLVPVLELASLARERLADLVDYKDTLTFIQEQEATGLWKAPSASVMLHETQPSMVVNQSEEQFRSYLLPQLAGAESISAILPDSVAEENNILAIEDSSTILFGLSSRLREALDMTYWEFKFNDFDSGFIGVSLDEILESLRKMKRAAVVSERTLGVATEETLRILLEVLRLLTRASSWTPASALLSDRERNAEVALMPGSSEIYNFANYISKKLDVLGRDNPDAVDGLVKKYSDLLSLSRLFQETGGSTLPDLNAPRATKGAPGGATTTASLKGGALVKKSKGEKKQ